MNAYGRQGSRIGMQMAAWVVACLVFPAGTMAQATTQPEAPAATPLPAVAEPATAPSAEARSETVASNVGVVKGNDVYVRSGFHQNYYPVTKLNKGDKVTVLGEEYGWLKVQPPAGTYSLVEKALIDKLDDHTGAANGDATIYAGSNLNNRRYAKQVRLARGDKVEIIGETPDGAFYKIQPPPGAVLWIKADLVDRSGKPESTATIEKIKPGELDLAAQSPPPATQPDAQASAAVAAPGAVPDRSPIDANRTQMDINAIEGMVAAEDAKPMTERSYEAVIARLRPMAEQSEDEVGQIYARTRIKQLEEQAGLVVAFREIRNLKEKAVATADQIAAERARIRAAEAAPIDDIVLRGEIQVSGIYDGAGGRARRWRVVSPDDRRTLAYIEVPEGSPIDPVQYYGKYVGIRASGRRIMQGTVPPVPVYTVREIVVQDPSARRESQRTSPSPHVVAPPVSQPTVITVTSRPAT